MSFHSSLTYSFRNTDPLPLPNPIPSSRLAEPSRSNSWDSVNTGIATSSLAFPHHFAPTPPLSYSSASTPEEMLVPSPPSTAASPVPNAFAHPAASTSSHGYPYLPPMYAPPTQAVTSTPLQHYPPPALDHSSYFDSIRRSTPSYPRLPPLAPPPSSQPQQFSYFTRYDPNRTYGTSSGHPIISRPPYDQSAPTNLHDQMKMPNSMYIPPPPGLPLPPPINRTQPLAYFDQSCNPALNHSSLSRPQSTATPTDPTFSLPYGYPSPGVQKEGGATTPGFNDIDSWLRGLAS